MLTFTELPLAATARALRSGQLDLADYINQTCDRLEEIDPALLAFMPFAGRRAYLLNEAKALEARFPDKASRPPLYGVLVGIKDLLHVDGFPTTAGSALPPQALTGPEGQAIKLLRQAGALILGKTVTAELAFFEPGPTYNPHNLKYSPGGSSSGSAAAVAVGLCALAIGTQTGGSVIRPAAFCGTIGFKPSYGRIPADGYIACAPVLDHFGMFTQDVAGMELAAQVLCRDWQSLDPASLKRPVLGVPEGPFLEQVSPEGRAGFETSLKLLEQAGYEIKRVFAAPLADPAATKQRQHTLVTYSLYHQQRELYTQYGQLYRPMTAQAVQDGQLVTEAEFEVARAELGQLRAELEALMQQHEFDIWVSPSALGPAPEGISTGDPAPNAPWTQAGLPTIGLPAGKAPSGLPLGLQCAAAFGHDEQLIAWAYNLAEIVNQQVATI